MISILLIFLREKVYWLNLRLLRIFLCALICNNLFCPNNECYREKLRLEVTMHLFSMPLYHAEVIFSLWNKFNHYWYQMLPRYFVISSDSSLYIMPQYHWLAKYNMIFSKFIIEHVSKGASDGTSSHMLLQIDAWNFGNSSLFGVLKEQL